MTTPAPGPLRRSWWVLAALALVLVAGGVVWAVQPDGVGGVAVPVQPAAPTSDVDPAPTPDTGDQGGTAAPSPSTPAAGTSGASPAAARCAGPAPAAVGPPTTAPTAPGTATGPSALLEHARAGRLTIGIKFDAPGLAVKNSDGGFAGFEVDVARYVAKALGVPESGITFSETPAAAREAAITAGEVDIVVATYSITQNRLEQVGFAGPYYVAHQDLLVRADDAAITGPACLEGRTLCSVVGSTAAGKVKDSYAPGARLVEYGLYADCIQALRDGEVDAVTTDDLVLAGYAAQNPGAFRVVGVGLSTESYGIGLAKGDAAGRAAVDDAIARMVQDGSWLAALRRNLGPSGLTFAPPPG